MNSRLKVQDPISSGQIVAAYDASTISNTDWNSVSSSDFYDTVTGAQIDANLKFAYIGAASSNTSTLSYIKLRAASGANDGITNSDAVIPVLSSYSVDSQALSSSSITSIAYKKADSSDAFILYCGFNRS
tara:strand:+ start:24752 stop:25141 length:390 start_codon:yes stop_codon:yes gene_type:complete